MRGTCLLLALPLLVSCSGGDDPSPAAPSSSPTGQVGATPSVRPAAQGDVDGDGRTDEVRYTGTTLVVRLSGSDREVDARTESTFEGDPGELSTAGVEDVDRDGRAEVFVQVGRGASTTFLLPFRYDGRFLAPLRVSEDPILLGIGGSTTHGDGFSCTDDGTLVVRSASSDDGRTFTVSTTTYRIQGHRLEPTGPSTVTEGALNDPQVQAAFTADCRSVLEKP